MIRVPIRPPSRITLADDLTLPTIEPPGWMSDGLCAGLGGGWDALTTDEQIAWCQPCPVVDVCREWGISTLPAATDDGSTVFGGLDPDAIVAEVRRRREARKIEQEATR